MAFVADGECASTKTSTFSAAFLWHKTATFAAQMFFADFPPRCGNNPGAWRAELRTPNTELKSAGFRVIEMVRRQPPRPAVAAHARSLRGVAFGNHVATNASQD